MKRSIVALALVCAALAGQARAADQLEMILSDPDNVDSAEKLPIAAVDAGPAAVPFLENQLSTATQDVRAFAAAALSYVGGDRAIDALRREYDRTHDMSLKVSLCVAAASRGSVEDRRFLVEALHGEVIGDEWAPIAAAALSLGVLHAAETTHALRDVVKRDPHSIAGGNAETALRWIRHGPWRVELPADATSNDRVLAAALANGLPWTEHATAFNREGNGSWALADGRWTLRQQALTQSSVTYTVHLSPDGRRAILSIARVLGPLNASGFSYLMHEELGAWTVDSVLFSWIS